MAGWAVEGNLDRDGSGGQKCLICWQVIASNRNVEDQVESQREESVLLLRQIARLLELSSNVYRETDLDALPVPLLCSSCHETVANGLELQDVISKLQAQLQRLGEMIKAIFIRSYHQCSGPMDLNDGNEELKRIRKTCVESWNQCPIRIEESYWCPSISQENSATSSLAGVRTEADEIKMEVELNPDQFEYDGFIIDGVKQTPPPSVLPETDSYTSNINTRKCNPAGKILTRAHSSNTCHLENEDTVQPECNEDLPLNLTVRTHEHDEMHHCIDVSTGHKLQMNKLETFGTEDGDLANEGSVAGTSLGTHFMSLVNNSIGSVNYTEQSAETKSKIFDSDNQMDSCSSNDDSDYNPSQTYRSRVKKSSKKLRYVGHGTNARQNEDRKCPYCNIYLSKRVDFDQHVDLHNGEKDFPCQLCTARFPSMSEIMSHNNHTHKYSSKSPSRTETGALKCNLCKQMFYSPTRFEIHMKQHENPEDSISMFIDTTLDRDQNITAFQCKLCSKKFSKESYMTSKNDLRILCQHGNCSCRVTFRDFKEFMFHHKNVCTKTYWSVRAAASKRFACEQCGETFATAQLMMIHQRCKHPARKTGGFVCNVCGVKFSDQNIMKNHMARCYPAVAFACQFCCQMCGRQDILNAHLLTHHPEKTSQLHNQMQQPFSLGRRKQTIDS